MEYPYFREPLAINSIHQADLLGPRYIKGDGRFYSLHILDLYSHHVFIHPQRRKDDDSVAKGLLRCWKTMGLPDFLQLDNALSFRGSDRYPRSFGIVLRLCLSLGIEVVFISIGEPWRNGTIERFNDTYNQRFFGTQWFRSYLQLRSQSKNFEIFHNKNRRYSYIKGKTPLQIIQENGFRPVFPPPRHQLSEIGPEIPDGTISLIRFIRSDQKLDIFGEPFAVPKSLIHSYSHQIQLYRGDEFVTTFSYRLPSWVDPNS